MNKTELKAALDLAGISYAKKATVAQLQAQLDENRVEVARTVVVGDTEYPLADPSTVDAEGRTLPSADADGMQRPTEAELAAMGASVAADILTMGEYGLGTTDADAVCPHCGTNHKDNGWQMSDEYEGATHTYICLGCNGQWGPLVPAPGAGLKIEKDRPEQNGVKRPSIGGKCRAIWDALDAYRSETSELPTSKVVKELAADEGWNPNNASIEFYQWRKFNGITKAK